jgi:hypothetical protein
VHRTVRGQQRVGADGAGAGVAERCQGGLSHEDGAVGDVVDKHGVPGDQRGRAGGRQAGLDGGEERQEVVAEPALCFHPEPRRCRLIDLQVAGVRSPGAHRGVQDRCNDRGPVGESEKVGVEEGDRDGAAPAVEGVHQEPAGFRDLGIDDPLLLVRAQAGQLLLDPLPLDGGPVVIGSRLRATILCCADGALAARGSQPEPRSVRG